MMFVHCPSCASPVRQGLVFCTDCGANMPHPELVAAFNARATEPRRRRSLRSRVILLRLQRSH